uniref:Amiloride-sensitive sodium channel subunit alpha n=1 Tax=Steinernema glaseri TaxID=37863 RepID=A0A1I7YDH4_9BILA
MWFQFSRWAMSVPEVAEMAFSEAEQRLIKKKRVKLVKDFAEHTSAHGCMLVHRSRTCRRRTFWTIAVALAWSICLYQIYIAVGKYFQYSTQTSVRIKHLNNVTFPAVTICNLNPIRNTWLLENYDLFSEINKLQEVGGCGSLYMPRL